MNAIFDFTKQRILVTGASSGIGREIALQLIASGAQVFALGRDAQALAQLGCETLCLDIANSAALDLALQGLPPMHGLVNCAGISRLEPARGHQRRSLRPGDECQRPRRGPGRQPYRCGDD